MRRVIKQKPNTQHTHTHNTHSVDSEKSEIYLKIDYCQEERRRHFHAADWAGGKFNAPQIKMYLGIRKMLCVCVCVCR